MVLNAILAVNANVDQNFIKNQKHINLENVVNNLQVMDEQELTE